ncbi:hypothetical protein [Nocardia sp. NPDC051981]|uniref:hypothetical protein n=1 Tax=Nocardia sp. NPDC051981 TaxID=3155417 RepID=UPI0034410B69
MDSKGETLDTCGIADLATAVQSLTNSVLHGNLNPFSDGDVVKLMQRLEACNVNCRRWIHV